MHEELNADKLNARWQTVLDEYLEAVEAEDSEAIISLVFKQPAAGAAGQQLQQPDGGQSKMVAWNVKLSLGQRRELYDALIAAFPTSAVLGQMVSFGLGENINVIAGGSSLSEIAFNLIQWAEGARSLAS